MKIQDEAYRRFPIQNVWEGENLQGHMIDVNEKNRNTFLEGANFALNSNKNDNSINIHIKDVPDDRKASLRDEIVRLMQVEFNLKLLN